MKGRRKMEWELEGKRVVKKNVFLFKIKERILLLGNRKDPLKKKELINW